MNSDNVIREGQILIGRVLGAHNGRLATADFLVKRLRRPQKSIPMRCFASSTALSRDDFERLLTLWRGRILVVFVRMDTPRIVYLLKDDMPLAVFHLPRFRTFFYASEEWMLQTALVCGSCMRQNDKKSCLIARPACRRQRGASDG